MMILIKNIYNNLLKGINHLKKYNLIYISMDKIDETLIKHKISPSERTRIWKLNNKQKVSEQYKRRYIKKKRSN
jgi:hypothetical protein